jgi:prefoldin subunit 5
MNHRIQELEKQIRYAEEDRESLEHRIEALEDFINDLRTALKRVDFNDS